MRKQETKAYGSVRKTKAYGAAGVILGLAALGLTTGVVQADEAVTGSNTNVTLPANTATNLTDSQGVPSSEAVATIAAANQAEGQVSVTVDNSKVDQAVANAKSEGVTVVQDSTVDKGTTTSLTETEKAQADIKADQEKQAEEIKKTTDDYAVAKEKNKAETDKVVAKNTAIESENKALQAAYNQANQASNDFTSDYNEDKVAVKKEFSDAKIDEARQDITVDPTSKESYDAYTQKVKQIQSENKQAIESYVTEKRKENKAISEAEAYNAEVRKRNEAGIATTKSENAEITKRNEAGQAAADKKNQEIASKNQTATSNAAAIEAENEAIKKRNETAESKYQTELAIYNKDKSDYDQKLKEVEANKGKDGFLSELVTNDLVFKEEPNIKNVTIQGAYAYISPKDEAVNSIQLWSYSPEYYLENPLKLTSTAQMRGALEVKYGGFDAESYWVIAERGKTLTITYDGAENSRYGDKKISKIVYELTPEKTEGNYPYVVFQIMKDPTLGFKYGSVTAEEIVDALSGNPMGKTDEELSKRSKLVVKYYDSTGAPINLEKGKAYVAAGSRNGGDGKGEYFKLLSDGRFISISGGSIGLDSQNRAIATGKQDKYPDWDHEDSINKWYGAAVFEVNGGQLEFEFGSVTVAPQEWFTFSSELFALGGVIPEPPKIPNKPTPEPLKPVTSIVPEQPVVFTPEKLKTFTPEKEKEVPTPKAKLSLVTVAPPVSPTFKPTEKLPEPPKVPIVHYHDYKLSAQPQLAKSVENADMVNINGQYVAKSSLNRFVLTPETLPANRPHTTSLVFKDPLPQGFLVDVAETQKANKGYTIDFNEKTNLITFTAESSVLGAVNKDTKSTYKLSPLYVWGRPQNDAADYENVFEMVVNGGVNPENPADGGYVRKSNKVTIHTSGKPNPETPNDPKNPNRDPLKPEKHNYNEKGELIDGKAMLPNAINHYKADWKLRPYSNLATSQESIAKGFAYIDDYQDEAVEGLESQFMITDALGNKVNGLKMYHVLSQDVADAAIKEMVKNSGISPVGAFYIWVAENPEEFYKAYVQKGLDISFNLPMKNKRDFTGEYQNQTFQIDFGNGYYSNIVKNHVPKLEAKKDVFVNMNDTDSKDGQEITLGDKFFYYLEGSTLPANRAEKLFDYSFKDDYDEKGDKFTGEFHVRALVDIKLTDGTIIKAGQEVTEFVNIDHSDKDGILTLAAKGSFLEKVSDDSEFGLAAFIQMERIASGTFENTFKHYVNDVEVISNTVKTTTQEPVKPQPETPSEPVKPAERTLPKTGEKSSLFVSAFGGFIAGAAAMLGLTKVKKEEKE